MSSINRTAEARRTEAPGSDGRFDLNADEASRDLLMALTSSHGDVFRVPSRTRGNDALVIHDPDAIRRVLLGNRGNYRKGAGLERVRMLLGNGLIVTEGDTWARQRRMMLPAFQGDVVRGFAPLVDEVNASLVAHWTRLAGRGDLFDITHDLSAIALDVVLRAIFGDDLRRIAEAEGESPFDLLTRDPRRDLAFAARFRALTRFVSAAIERRRVEPGEERDLLAMMMAARDRETGEAMSGRELVDQVMTLIVAGHETTAATLNWAWYMLSQHPGIDARLHATVCDPARGTDLGERPAAQDPGSGDFVERVLQETLRMFPPVWLFSRRAVGDDELAGAHVPAGTDVFICPWLLHRRPAHWQRPDEFEPDRFLPEASGARHRFAFLPFSAGPRFCIGAGFAMAEMSAHLTQVASRFRVVYDGPPMEAEFQINLRMRDNLRVRLAPR
jgi:cytochrome P450